MATRGVVIDRHGNVVEDDDDIVRDGERLTVPIEFMDHRQRAVIADLKRRNLPKRALMRDAANPYAISDAQRLRVLDDFKERLGAGMHRHRVVTELPYGVADGKDFDRTAAAYDAMKKRLGAPKAKRYPKPVGRLGA